MSLGPRTDPPAALLMPLQAQQVEDATTGCFALVWFRFLTAIQGAVNYLLGLNLATSIAQLAPYITDLTLTAASTTINPPPQGTTNSVWVVIVRQDGTGGRAIVWGSAISGASVNIDTTASTLSTFLFAYSSAANSWVMCCQPTTGMV